MALIVPKGWVFLFLLNGKSTCWPLKYDKLFGDENEPPFQTDITLSLTKNFRVFPHFGLIYARSCQNISLEYDRNYKNRSLRSYLGCCQDVFKIHNSRNPDQTGKLLAFLIKIPGVWWNIAFNSYGMSYSIFTCEFHFESK